MAKYILENQNIANALKECKTVLSEGRDLMRKIQYMVGRSDFLQAGAQTLNLQAQQLLTEAGQVHALIPIWGQRMNAADVTIKSIEKRINDGIFVSKYTRPVPPKRRKKIRARKGK